MTVKMKDVEKYMKRMLRQNNKWALKALLVVYDNQTSDEKAIKATKYWNKMGFNSYDAEILSSYAEQYKDRGFLTKRQMTVLKRRIPSYWRQLVEVSDEQKLEVQVLADMGQQLMIEPFQSVSV